jgi:hypothetical protein
LNISHYNFVNISVLKNMKEKKQITAPRALNLVMPSFKTRFYKESFKSRKEYDFLVLDILNLR